MKYLLRFQYYCDSICEKWKHLRLRFQIHIHSIGLDILYQKYVYIYTLHEKYVIALLQYENATFSRSFTFKYIFSSHSLHLCLPKDSVWSSWKLQIFFFMIFNGILCCIKSWSACGRYKIFLFKLIANVVKMSSNVIWRFRFFPSFFFWIHFDDFHFTSRYLNRIFV